MDDKIMFEKDSKGIKNSIYLQRNVFFTLFTMKN